MATMPTFSNGEVIDANKWNAHANQINANTTSITALEGGGATGRAARYKNTSSTQVFGNSTETTVLSWGSGVIPSADISYANGNFTFNRTGLWLVLANINLMGGGGTTNAERIIKIYYNSAVEAFAAIRSPGGGDHTFLNTFALLNVTTTGTSAYVTVSQGTGGNMQIRPDSTMQLIWIRGS